MEGTYQIEQFQGGFQYIETCNRDIEIAAEEAQIEEEDAIEDNEIE